MKQKIYKIGVLFLLASFVMIQKSYAKYVLQENQKLAIFVDKTPPIIYVTSDGETENFDKTQVDPVKKTDSVTITTSDNIGIKDNEYCYHPSKADWEGAERHKFEHTLEITEEGYYEVIATDTSGNCTKIIILLQRSAPTVLVEYFKKDGVSVHSRLDDTRKVAGITKYWTTEDKIELTEEREAQTEDVVEQTQEKEIEQEEILQTEEIKHTEEIREEFFIENNEKEPIVESQEKLEEDMETISAEQQIMTTAVNEIYVGNEAEFRNALSMQASIIYIRKTIDFTAPIDINYAVSIAGASSENALRYWNTGNFFNVQNGGRLIIDGVVIDTNSSGINGITAVNIQAGGYVACTNSSIIDGGLSNTGILINGGGSLVLWSCEIVRCGFGINLQTNGNLYFATQEGRCNNLYWNTTAILIDNFYGVCHFDQNISIHNNTQYGILIGNSVGQIQLSAGNYYENTYCIHTRNINGGNVTISGGSYFSNGWAIWVGGNLNLQGGVVYKNDYGILTDSSYSGNFQMTGGEIHSNFSCAIYHKKTNDGGCTITGGSISGEVFLEKEDNYVNTNSSYPSFTVTPSSYYFKRKLVKTTDNHTAHLENPHIVVTPKGAWYQYVDKEYIVLWSGGNVIARYKDYDGNIIQQETINGEIGTSYSIVPPTILGYDLINVPSNCNGIYSQQDIFVDFQYDLVNVAKVTFEDLLSGVVSAQYWYHEKEENFSGDGVDFVNGTVFEKYGYYKVMVTNGVGLEKEMIFSLNKDSFIR